MIFETIGWRGVDKHDLRSKALNKPGIVIEFKKVEKKETPEETLARAMTRIEDRRYATELEAAGVKNLLKLAIAFRGKELWVKSEVIL